MSNTTYTELADAVFNKIKDHDFLSMDESVAYEIVTNYINAACVKFQNCTQDLSGRDDNVQEFHYALTDVNFEILTNYMVIEWLTSNFILTQQALKARLTNADFHALGTKDMLPKVIALRDGLMAENDQLARNKGYLKSSLYDVATGRKANV